MLWLSSQGKSAHTPPDTALVYQALFYDRNRPASE